MELAHLLTNLMWIGATGSVSVALVSFALSSYLGVLERD